MSTPTTSAARLLENAVADGIVPGGVIAHGHDPEPVAAGALAVDGPPMRPDAIFRIQSMTKLVTAVAALRLVERGELALDSPVAPWMPELAAARVVRSPGAALEDTVPADRPITLRHLLTCTSGYGMILAESPLQRAMAESSTEAGPLPPTLGAEDWLAALSALPLVGQPGEVWRYHHSFGLLGIMLARISGESTAAHLERTLFAPLGLRDTGFTVAEQERDRIPAAYAVEGDRLVEREAAGGGVHVGEPPDDLGHGELLSTASDYLRFLQGLRDGELLGAEHLEMLRSDQVPPEAKDPAAFFPGFWEASSWGFGVCVVTEGPHRGRWGWSGGAGTDFFVDPDGTLGLLLTQVEIGSRIMPLLEAYQELPAPPR
ncbi:serine hydrolase domain-containing protein [Brachybacterium sp. AOP43-C2-M15]|uniref:serine hydrolase domain-containing protein n=1 Tax=Brachybacterium sp. AOP43-C2-M15 TaxID=3457661 RepID=UPI00403413DC